MKIAPITTEEQYDKMLEWVDRQFDDSSCLKISTKAQLQTALLFIKAYEEVRYPINT